MIEIESSIRSRDTEGVQKEERRASQCEAAVRLRLSMRQVWQLSGRVERANRTL